MTARCLLTTGSRRAGRPLLPLALAAVLATGGVACAAPATSTTAGTQAGSWSSAPTATTAGLTPSSSNPADSASASPSSLPSVAATAPGTTVTPSDLGSATCYSTPELDRSDNSLGIGFGYKEGEGYDNTVSVAMFADACHQSLVARGAIAQSDPVAACVLADGTVGVLPGGDDLCSTLGLPVAAADASAPIRR